MSLRLSAKRYFVALTTVAAMLAGLPALAELVFTSEPRTNVAVGEAYSYEMKALDLTDDDEEDSFDRLRFIARALPRWLSFDKDDTIFGTPGAEDVGVHRVRLRARVKGEHVDQEFSITVEAAPANPPSEGADLAASVTVTPNAIFPGDAVMWTVTARNLANTDVANVVLETAFSGDAPFTIDDVDDESCSIEPRGDHTALVCRWSPLASGRSRSAEASGNASGPGEVLAVARASIADAAPTDRNPANDEARVMLKVNDEMSDSDGSPPVLTLNGASTVTVTVGETYEDAGATARDDVDGDLTNRILVDNPVDTNMIGRYSVTYDVLDSAGNLTTATRTVEVVPREATGGGGGGAAGTALLLLLACTLGAQRANRPGKGSQFRA